MILSFTTLFQVVQCDTHATVTECSTPAGVSSSLFVLLWWTRNSLSSMVGLFCGGSVDVTELSLENDGVWQQQANGCRRSSQSAKPLVTMWWWMRTAGVCRQALHPSQARTKHKAYRGWNVSSILVDEGCGFTKQDMIPIYSVRTLYFFSRRFLFLGGKLGLFFLLCIYCVFISYCLWLSLRYTL